MSHEKGHPYMVGISKTETRQLASCGVYGHCWSAWRAEPRTFASNGQQTTIYLFVRNCYMCPLFETEYDAVPLEP